MQSFWQRLQNYIMKNLVAFMMTSQVNSIKDFVRQTGQSFREHDTTRSSAAAVVVTSDFALDYPRPIAPKLHVSQ